MANGYYIGLDRTKDTDMACGCGRSPTGKCIGWHNLTEQQYQEKLKDYNEQQVKEAKAEEND